MTPHPSRDHAGDARLVSALRAHHRGVAAQVYDVYGTRLFAYAVVLLGDHGLAGRAVRAALLAARSKADTVPDPDRFRAWLYALVRDECLSRLGDRPAETPQPAPVATPPDDPVQLEPGRLVFHYALATPDDLVRESADLTLRHHLGTRELAEVLGISAHQAADLEARVNATLATPNPAPEPPTRPAPTPAPTPKPTPRPTPRAAARSDLTPTPSTSAPSTGGEPSPRAKDSPGRVRARTDGERRRKHKKMTHRVRLGATALVTAGLALIVMFALLARSPDGRTTEREPQAHAPVDRLAVEPQPTGASPPSTPPGRPPPPGGGIPPATTPTSSAPGSPPNSPPAQPGRPPSEPPKDRKPAPPPAAGHGRLSVSDGGCKGIAAPLSRRCGITLTAVGGTVRWSVASVNEGIADVDASGSGTLSSGQSTTVTVTIKPTVRCYASGFGSGSIGFAPGGTAGISYTCW